MKTLFAAAIAAASLALLACTPHPSIYADNQPAETHEVRVISADHLVIDSQDLTLADAVAPKAGDQAACEAERLAGVEAAAKVRSMLLSARHLEVQSTTGEAHRRLVNVDGLDLGQALIGQGVAVAPRAEPMDWCLRASLEPRRFAAAETSVRTN